MAKIYLGFAGKAGSGKDTLFNIIHSELSGNGNMIWRWSIGDQLKNQLQTLECFNTIKADLKSLKGNQKEIWRPLMAAYGDACRRETNGRYFIDILMQNKIFTSHCAGLNARIVTDIRFDQYEKDEVYWLKEELGGKLIYIDRYTTDLEGNKSPIPFVNDLERSQDEKLREKADMIISWPTVSDRNILLEYARPLINRIKQDWLPV